MVLFQFAALPGKFDNLKVQVTQPVFKVICHKFFNFLMFINGGVHVTPKKWCLVPENQLSECLKPWEHKHQHKGVHRCEKHKHNATKTGTMPFHFNEHSPKMHAALHMHTSSQKMSPRG